MRAVSIFKCKGSDESELTFALGDVLAEIQATEEDGWFRGTLMSSGERGLFPGNYVRFEQEQVHDYNANSRLLPAAAGSYGRSYNPPEQSTNFASQISSMHNGSQSSYQTGDYGQSTQTPLPNPRPDHQATTFNPEGQVSSYYGGNQAGQSNYTNQISEIPMPNTRPTADFATYSSNIHSAGQAIYQTQPIYPMHSNSTPLPNLRPSRPPPPSSDGHHLSAGPNIQVPSRPPVNHHSGATNTQSMYEPPEPPYREPVVGTTNDLSLQPSHLNTAVKGKKRPPAPPTSSKSVTSSLNSSMMTPNPAFLYSQQSLRKSPPSSQKSSVTSTPRSSVGSKTTALASRFDSMGLCSSSQDISNANTGIVYSGLGSNGSVEIQADRNRTSNIQEQTYSNQEGVHQSQPPPTNYAPKPSNLRGHQLSAKPVIASRPSNITPQLTPSNKPTMALRPQASMPIFDKLANFETVKPKPRVPDRPASVAVMSLGDYPTNPQRIVATSRPGPVPRARPPVRSERDITKAIPRYLQLFSSIDKWNTGRVSLQFVKSVWSKSQLEFKSLGLIWNLLHVWDESLSREEFCVGMWLIDVLLGGDELVKSADALRASIGSL